MLSMLVVVLTYDTKGNYYLLLFMLLFCLIAFPSRYKMNRQNNVSGKQELWEEKGKKRADHMRTGVV